MSIQLGRKRITRDSDNVYVIAEIGQNHQGNLDIAKELILQAKIAKANCVKFQKSCLTEKFTKSALERCYDSPNSWGKTYGEHKEFLEFNQAEYKELKLYCSEIEIDFTASAMDEISLDFLESLDVPFIKIGSGDANNFPLLKKAATLKCPLVISTGMQCMATVDEIFQIMTKAQKQNFALLHCVSSYPTAPEDCNLQMINIFKEKFPNILIGYSGHELGIEISITAVLLGARILERHFTLDKSLKGSDHKCSLIPNELKKMIENINELKNTKLLTESHLELDEIISLSGNSLNVQSALKNIDSKKILVCELSCKTKLGKSLVAAKDLHNKQLLQQEDICIKVSEPNGIPAEEYYNIIGCTMQRDIGKDCPINEADILQKST